MSTMSRIHTGGDVCALHSLRLCLLRALALLLLFTLHTGASLQCVQCDSNMDASCIDDPPAPRNCTGCNTWAGKCTSLDVCVQVRKLDRNWTLLEVTRSCFPVLYNKDFCTLGKDNTRGNIPVHICQYFCSTDGCNHAATTDRHVYMLLLGVALSSLYLAYFMMATS